MTYTHFNEGEVQVFEAGAYSTSFRSCLFVAIWTPTTARFVAAHARALTNDKNSPHFLRGDFTEYGRAFILDHGVHLGNVSRRAIELLPEAEYMKIIASTRDTLEPVLATVPDEINLAFRIVGKDLKRIYFEDGRARIVYCEGPKRGQEELF